MLSSRASTPSSTSSNESASSPRESAEDKWRVARAYERLAHREYDYMGRPRASRPAQRRGPPTAWDMNHHEPSLAPLTEQAKRALSAL
jgi:hypothetical protein